jgi:hypothetical protein
MEISPEKSETIAFLRQDPVRCKILVVNKCLQKVNIPYENEKISNNNNQMFSNTGNSKRHFQTNFGQE